MNIKCSHCSNNFKLTCNSFSYWNSDFSLAGICSTCYSDIDNKLKLLVDESKLTLIRKKAIKKRMMKNKIFL